MSVLESIIVWAEELPGWQSDAVRRLLTQDKLTEEDKAELLDMLKKHHGLGDPKRPVPDPRPPRKGKVSGAPRVSEKITLKAMNKLSNVNAIPDGSSLAFGHEGLTAIYGENATGKSGYVRVLKRACNARDTKERILPNIFQKVVPRPAKATFKISRSGGPDEDVNWEEGRKGAEVLTNIAVFDSKCARVIVDGNNKITYLPYGSYVFPGLVELLKELRFRLNYEKPKLAALEYDDIPSGTEAANFMERLRHGSVTQRIEQISKWTSEDKERLAQLRVSLLKADAEDPAKAAQKIRNGVERISQLRDKILEIDSALSKEKVTALEGLIERVNAAEKALVIVSQESLAKEPLPGAGGSAWQILYEAAKQYSVEEAYQGKEFPQIGDESRCVFCMQTLLEEGKVRLRRFKEFMEQTTKKNVDSARKCLADTLEAVEKLDFGALETYSDALAKIRDRDEELASKIEEYFQEMQTRAGDMVKVGREKNFEFVTALKQNPIKAVEKVMQGLLAGADEMEKTADPKELAKLRAEKDSLEGRRILGRRRKNIGVHMERLKVAQKYDACIQETTHTGITKKATEVISGALTPELVKALGDELRMMGAYHLRLGLRPSGEFGETAHKMELPDGGPLEGIKLTDILSEGEEHVVGIAGFLAELRVSRTECPIVMDDPVCSLDHQYRERVAERLVKESLGRQVVVFTHDIAFLLDLESKAGELGAYFCPQTVKRMNERPGISFAGLPWHAMSWQERKNYLKDRAAKINKLYSDDKGSYNEKAALLYGLLRETWESVVEEFILNKTVRRHGKEVQTKRLKYVDFTTSDYKAIQKAMGKCSTWMVGHSKSKALDVNRPSPDEVKSDIEGVEVFVKEVKQRRKGLEGKREGALKPESTSVG